MLDGMRSRWWIAVAALGVVAGWVLLEWSPAPLAARRGSFREDSRQRESVAASDAPRARAPLAPTEPDAPELEQKLTPLQQALKGLPLVHVADMPKYEPTKLTTPIEEGTSAASDRDFQWTIVMAHQTELRDELEARGVPFAEALQRCAPADSERIKSQDQRFCEDLRPAPKLCERLLDMSELLQKFVDRSERSSADVQPTLAAKALELTPFVVLARNLCS